MLRRDVIFSPNQYYYFYNRSNNRQTIFFDRDNYRYFLQSIKKYLYEQMDVIACCLMPNHYHILVQIHPETQISEV